MKKTLTLTIFLVFCLSFFASCGKKKDDALSLIKKSGIIKIGFSNNFPPFEFKNNNKLEGIDIDIGNEIAKKIGVRAEFIETSFKNIFSDLNALKYDIVISGITVTKQRALNVRFSDSYFSESNNLIINKNFNNITNSYIDNKKIGVESNSSQFDLIKDHTNNIYENSNYNKMANMLANNKLDGIYAAGNIARLIVEEHNNLQISHINIDISNKSEDYAIALPGIKQSGRSTVNSGEDYESLLKLVNNTINEIKNNGFLKHSIEKNIKNATLN